MPEDDSEADYKYNKDYILSGNNKWVVITKIASRRSTNKNSRLGLLVPTIHLE